MQQQHSMSNTPVDKNQLAIDVFDRNAALYQQKFMNVDMYGPELDLVCERIDQEDARILDVACGPGNITRYLLDRYPGYQILGIDLAPQMLDLGRVNNPTAEFLLMDARHIGSIGRVFECVIVGFCMPYLSKEEAIQLIADAASILTEDGVLYLSTMEDSYERSGIQRSSSGNELYMYFHEEGYLSQALRDNGFIVLTTERKKYAGSDGSPTVDLVIVARKATSKTR